MVEAPRSRPRHGVDGIAEMMPSGSTPVLVQNDLSSIAVVASIRMGGSWSKVTGSRRSPALKRASSTVSVRS